MKSATQIVDEQIVAYRERNAAAFAACYEDDAVCEMYETGEPIARGRTAIQRIWGADFQTGLDGLTIDQRIVAGRIVIDLEVAKFTGQTARRAVAIYETGPERIKRVRFIFDPNHPEDASL